MEGRGTPPKGSTNGDQTPCELCFSSPGIPLHAERRRNPLKSCRKGSQIPKIWASFLQPPKQFSFIPGGETNTSSGMEKMDIRSQRSSSVSAAHLEQFSSTRREELTSAGSNLTPLNDPGYNITKYEQHNGAYSSVKVQCYYTDKVWLFF